MVQHPKTTLGDHTWGEPIALELTVFLASKPWVPATEVYLLCTWQALVVGRGTWQDGYLAIAYRELWEPCLGWSPAVLVLGDISYLWGVLMGFLWTITHYLLQSFLLFHPISHYCHRISHHFAPHILSQKSPNIRAFASWGSKKSCRLGIWICVSAALANTLLYTSELAPGTMEELGASRGISPLFLET